MPASEVWILHGLAAKGGSKKMARSGRCKKYARVWDPVTGTYARKCVSRYASRSSGLSGIGSVANFGQATGLKGTFNSVKGVMITGAIAVGGAFLTQRVYEKIGKELKLSGWKSDLAEIATGVALGLVIGKFLKRPKLAAAFAIGPVVNGGIKLANRVLAETAGLGGPIGMTAFEPVTPYSSMYAPLYGTSRKALGSSVSFDTIGPTSYQQVAQPLATKRMIPVPGI